ncbi:MAG: RluA family pseudouridine synthase [Planctomycetota bacterium]|nr:RluA family pseudouridine synthase [Planctomycetota bacterium]
MGETLPHKNAGYSYKFQIQDSLPGETISQLLERHFHHSTRQQWLERILQGEIMLGERLLRADCPSSNGDRVIWNRPGWLEATVPRSFSVLYEDESLLAVNKPAGLPTIPGGGFLENTLLHLVHERFTNAPRPLHRLGRGTSGVVLFAKDQNSARHWSRHWKEVEKTYLAMVAGRPNQPVYDIKVPIGPIDHPKLGTVHSVSASGKASRSVARVARERGENTVMEVDLYTGRPHQIRIHLASIGHPLVGDPMYGPSAKLLSHAGVPSDLGYQLHAWRMRLNCPTNKKKLELEAPVPTGLE